MLLCCSKMYTIPFEFQVIRTAGLPLHQVKEKVDAEIQGRILIARREEVFAMLHAAGNRPQQRPMLTLHSLVRGRKVEAAGKLRFDPCRIASNPRAEHGGCKFGR